MAEILRRAELSCFTPSSEAQGVLFVGGLGSVDSEDLKPVAKAVAPLVPSGSPLVLQDFTFGINFAPMGPYRNLEERRTVHSIEKLAAKTGKPVIVFGESLGGLIAVGASNKQTDKVMATVLLGTPATAPYIGISELSSHQTIYSIHGENDPLAPVVYAPRSRYGEVKISVLPGVDHLSLKGRSGLAAVTEAFTAILAQPPKTLVAASLTRMHS